MLLPTGISYVSHNTRWESEHQLTTKDTAGRNEKDDSETETKLHTWIELGCNEVPLHVVVAEVGEDESLHNLREEDHRRP